VAVKPNPFQSKRKRQKKKERRQRIQSPERGELGERPIGTCLGLLLPLVAGTKYNKKKIIGWFQTAVCRSNFQTNSTKG